MAKHVKILGNQKNTNYFKEAENAGRLSHAYIISGEKGSGKKTFADYIAAELLCINKGPCGKCPSCIKAETRNHPDIIHVTHLKDNLISVEEIRSQLVKDVCIKPYYGPYKIYIVNDAELMNVSAQNALLKTIEEPPSYTIIFLLTSNADGLLETIKSRCVKIDMERLPDKVIRKTLEEEYETTMSEAFECAAFTRGNLGKAIAVAKGLDSTRKTASEILSDIYRKDALDIYNISEKMEELDTKSILETVYIWFRDVLVIKATSTAEDLYFPENRQELCRQAETISYEDLNSIFKKIEKAKTEVYMNVKKEAAFEELLLYIRKCLAGRA